MKQMQKETDNKMLLSACILSLEALNLVLWAALVITCCAGDARRALGIIVMRSLLYVLRAKESRRWGNDD